MRKNNVNALTRDVASERDTRRYPICSNVSGQPEIVIAVRASIYENVLLFTPLREEESAIPRLTLEVSLIRRFPTDRNYAFVGSRMTYPEGEEIRRSLKIGKPMKEFSAKRRRKQ